MMFGPRHDPSVIGWLSAGDPVIPCWPGQIFLGAGCVGDDPNADIWPYLQPCTASDAEIEARLLCGDFSCDVIEQHSTTIWFRNRAGWREAWRVSRCIARGRKVAGLTADALYCWPDFAVELSAHHAATATEAA